MFRPATHDSGLLHTVPPDRTSNGAVALFPAQGREESRAFCRAAPRDLRLVLSPSEGASRRGEAKRAYSQNNNMVNLFLTEAGFSGVANCGVCGTLEAGADRKGKFDQSTGAFIERAGLMTPFPQMCEGAPDVRIKTFELRDGLGKFLSDAHAPFSKCVSGPSLAGEALAIRKIHPTRTQNRLDSLRFDHTAM